ncbi:predicted protein [Nematostella vectensis]|uniref:Uncharacterized protein n=1 Tax=Nematostella vectensis TaxID=45351 RepID=A7STJ9_NEMVE|nr:predicted protein [Nematostella vectensis]|eukprot:XP_001625069.1 predicted protein [Nematostella vectensis]
MHHMYRYFVVAANGMNIKNGVISLLSEYHGLYELQRNRLQAQIGSLTEERDLWGSAAYTLALKVTDKHSLNTAKKLHLCEKSLGKARAPFRHLPERERQYSDVFQAGVWSGKLNLKSDKLKKLAKSLPSYILSCRAASTNVKYKNAWLSWKKWEKQNLDSNQFPVPPFCL